MRGHMLIKDNRENKNTGICVKYAIQIVTRVSFVVIGMMLFLRVSDMSVYANEFSTQSYNSVEVRKRVLELLAEGKFDYGNKEYLVQQSTNRRIFRVQSTRTSDEFEIAIIPKIDDRYTFPSQGAWTILFDDNNDIDSIVYYIQGNGTTNNKVNNDVSMIVKPYDNAIQVSALFGKDYLYEDILIPLSIRNFFLMPTEQFFEYTTQLLYWDWVLPQTKFADINARSRNIVNYIQQNLRIKKDRMDNLFDDAYLEYGALARNEVLAKRRAMEIEYIQDNIDIIMQYLGTDLVDRSMFNPYDVNQQVIPNFHKEYLRGYIENVVSFLQEFPDFFTPIKVLETPFTQENFRELYMLYNELYTMTTKNPGLMYIVPVRKHIQDGELTSDVIISMEVLIPYFTLSGAFKVYGWNIIQTYLNDENADKTKSIKYFFDEVGILRVPNKRVYRSLEE